MLFFLLIVVAIAVVAYARWSSSVDNTELIVQQRLSPSSPMGYTANNPMVGMVGKESGAGWETVNDLADYIDLADPSPQPRNVSIELDTSSADPSSSSPTAHYYPRDAFGLHSDSQAPAWSEPESTTTPSSAQNYRAAAKTPDHFYPQPNSLAVS